MNKVKFNLKDRKADESLIFLIYRYDGNKFKMSTGIKVKVKHWNDAKQSIREVAGFYEYSGYNADLKRFEEAVHKALMKQIGNIINELKNVKIEVVSHSAGITFLKKNIGGRGEHSQLPF